MRCLLLVALALWATLLASCVPAQAHPGSPMEVAADTTATTTPPSPQCANGASNNQTYQAGNGHPPSNEHATANICTRLSPTTVSSTPNRRARDRRHNDRTGRTGR